MNITVNGPKITCLHPHRLPQTLLLDGLSPASRLLEKRRQMFEVQETLEAQKQDFNRKVNILDSVRYFDV